MTTPRTPRFPIEAIQPDSEYFALTLGADEHGKIWTEGQTMWTGFDEKDERIEIRELSLVHAERIAAIGKDFHEPFVVVNTDTEWANWCLGGGHALIKPEMVKKHMPWELEPRRCVQEGAIGFTPLKSLPKTAFNRAPTPKLRMNVMERDQFRCVLCGRRSSDYVDVEIHVHHIRPFGKRGVTTAKNLVSLCHTCHKGLDPHFNWDLYRFADDFLKDEKESDGHKQHRDSYLGAVERYRKVLADDISRLARTR